MYKASIAVAITGWSAALVACVGLVWLIQVSGVSDAGVTAAAVRNLPVGAAMQGEPVLRGN